MNGKLKVVALLATMASSLGATWADLPLEFHVKRADAIAKVLIVSRTPFFKTPDEIVTQWEALTDCGVGVLKDRHKPGDPPLKQCSTIIIETNGGEAGAFMVIDTSEPRLQEGESYWLFLLQQADGTYKIADGALNTYKAKNGKLDTINDRAQGWDEAKFKQEVKKLAEAED